MENLKLRCLLVIILLAVTATVVRGLQYGSSKEEVNGLDTLKVIPTEIGKWRGQDFALEEMVYEILETRAIIHRSFSAGDGKNVFLSLVHYSDTKVDFHQPEACIGGEGLKTKKTTKAVTFFSGGKNVNLDITQLLTTRENGQTLTYYFYKAGSFIGNNYIKMRLSIAANKLARNDTRGSLIRVSTALIPGNEAEAEVLLRDFIEDSFPYIVQL